MSISLYFNCFACSNLFSFLAISNSASSFFFEAITSSRINVGIFYFFTDIKKHLNEYVEGIFSQGMASLTWIFWLQGKNPSKFPVQCTVVIFLVVLFTHLKKICLIFLCDDTIHRRFLCKSP